MRPARAARPHRQRLNPHPRLQPCPCTLPLHARYSYLDDVDEDDEVVHPDIAADFGGEYTGEGGIERLLARVIALTTATGTEESAAGPTHWSTGATQRRGKMIHHHPAGPEVPHPHCCRNGKCKSSFPKPPAAKTHVGADGLIVYRRRPCDSMVVAYNPWITLYFTSHINVEVVCSSLHVISYLFKYILKGPDRNRIQLVMDGDAQRGQQGEADTSTHRRNERPDQIAHWRNATETCAPHAYRRHAELITGIQEPAVEKIVVHDVRQRDANPRPSVRGDDVGLSPQEIYLARPLLPTDISQEVRLPRENHNVSPQDAALLPCTVCTAHTRAPSHCRRAPP